MTNDQYDFTSRFEGVVPHLYRDSEGNVTCGVGFLVSSQADLLRMPWSPNVQAAIADYHNVRDTDPTNQHVAGFFKPLCSARLSDLSMRSMFDIRVAALRRELGDWHLATLPTAAQIALVDMGYNLGAHGLNEYVRLRAAVTAHAWAIAASECHRLKIGDDRNDATRGLFLSCAA